MSDDSKAADSRKATPDPSKSASTPTTPPQGPGDAKGSTPVTEKAVPSRPVPETTQYLLTVDNRTGQTTKVEKVEGQTGDKKELTPQEYSALVSGSPAATIGGIPPSPAIAPWVQAYWQGYNDYLKAVTPTG
jgi:hypothetical protein